MATETAIIRMGLQSIAPRPHYLHLNSVTQQTSLACPSRSPVLVGYTLLRQLG